MPSRVGWSKVSMSSSNSTSGGPGRRHGHRAAGREAVVGLPAGDLDVLEAEQRLRADDDRGVLGQRLDGLVELELQAGDDRPVLAGDGRDRGDRADPGAADAHLVAAHEVRRVGDVDVDLVGRDERQAAVGVVGEEHRDGDHEDRDRADQDGVREGAGSGAPHLSSPPNRKSMRSSLACAPPVAESLARVEVGLHAAADPGALGGAQDVGGLGAVEDLGGAAERPVGRVDRALGGGRGAARPPGGTWPGTPGSP